MPSIIGKWELFRIEHTILLEGVRFFKKQNKITFFFFKSAHFFGRKENTIR